MSLCTVRDALRRIEAAEPESPIVLLRSSHHGVVAAFFFETVYGHQVVNENHHALIGVFHSKMPLKDVERRIFQKVFGV